MKKKKKKGDLLLKHTVLIDCLDRAVGPRSPQTISFDELLDNVRDRKSGAGACAGPQDKRNVSEPRRGVETH